MLFRLGGHLIGAAPVTETAQEEAKSVVGGGGGGQQQLTLYRPYRQQNC